RERESSSSGLMSQRKEDRCQTFIRAYPTQNGTASTMSYSCRNDGAKSFTGKYDVNWGEFSTPWQDRMSDHRSASNAGPCAYVHRHPTKASRCIRDWVSEREECDRHRPTVRQRAKLYGRAFLGSGLRCFHGRVRAGTGSQIHPRTRGRGW